MSSVALQILDAIETRLKVASVQSTVFDRIEGEYETFTPPTGLTVGREIIGLVTERHVVGGPIISVAKGGELPSSRKHHKDPLTVRTMEVLITVAAKAEDVTPSNALDAPSNWVIQALQSEPTLDGIAHYISEEGSEDEYTTYQESTFVLAARQMRLHVTFHSRTDNPEVRS